MLRAATLVTVRVSLVVSEAVTVVVLLTSSKYAPSAEPEIGKIGSLVEISLDTHLKLSSLIGT